MNPIFPTITSFLILVPSLHPDNRFPHLSSYSQSLSPTPCSQMPSLPMLSAFSMRPFRCKASSDLQKHVLPTSLTCHLLLVDFVVCVCECLCVSVCESQNIHKAEWFLAHNKCSRTISNCQCGYSYGYYCYYHYHGNDLPRYSTEPSIVS